MPVEQPDNVEPPIFREVQRFNQIWLWIGVLGLAALQWRLVFKYHLWQPPFTGRSRWELLLYFFWFFFGVVLPVFIGWCHMITEVRKDGVYVQFVPVHKTFQKIPFTDFKRYEMRSYRAIMDYGGWGVRQGSKGRAYIISGGQGIEFTFVDGERLLVGSQNVREFLQAIHWNCAGRRGPPTMGGRKQ